MLARLRRPPGDGESAGELAAGAAAGAARLRIVTWGTAEQAAWSEAMTAESWRWAATGAAVTCDVSRLLLESLAGRPGLFTGMPRVALQLRAAGETAAGACARWREVAPAWNDITTETRGLTAPGIPDPGDLITGLGRLAFTDPQWTPGACPALPAARPGEAGTGPGAVHGRRFRGPSRGQRRRQHRRYRPARRGRRGPGQPAARAHPNPPRRLRRAPQVRQRPPVDYRRAAGRLPDGSRRQ